MMSSFSKSLTDLIVAESIIVDYAMQTEQLSLFPGDLSHHQVVTSKFGDTLVVSAVRMTEPERRIVINCHNIIQGLVCDPSPVLNGGCDALTLSDDGDVLAFMRDGNQAVVYQQTYPTHHDDSFELHHAICLEGIHLPDRTDTVWGPVIHLKLSSTGLFLALIAVDQTTGRHGILFFELLDDRIRYLVMTLPEMLDAIDSVYTDTYVNFNSSLNETKGRSEGDRFICQYKHGGKISRLSFMMTGAELWNTLPS